MRGDGQRPCYSAERPRPDDAAGIAKPRATLGNGRCDRPDGTGPGRRAFLSPFGALPGECGGRQGTRSAGGPAVFMLLCRRLPLSRDPLPGVGAGARGGRAASGGRAGTIAAGEAGRARGRGAAGPWRALAVRPRLRRPSSARLSSRRSRVHVWRGKGAGVGGKF